MKSYQYGSIFLGWIPAKRMQSGGRFCVFRNKKEYEEAYRKVTAIEKKRDLDRMLAAAGIRGGRCREYGRTR